MNNKIESKGIILFDGVCNLCNGFVQFVIERDPKKQFLFTSLQSEKGKKILELHDIKETSLASIQLIQDAKIYKESTAILKILQKLRGGWFLLYLFIILPQFFRDWCYQQIAKNRYILFGKQNACWLPTPELQERFL